MDYFNPLFGVVALQAILYLIVVFGSSLEYRKYLLSDNPRTTKQIAYLMLTFVILSFIVTPLLLYVIECIYMLVAVLVTIPTVLLLSWMKQRRFFKCSEKREEELDGIRFIVCRNKVDSAWYDEKDKKMYVSPLLKEMLSEEELKAVLHRELYYVEHIKHSRLSFLRYLRYFIDAYWIWAVVTIVLLLPLLDGVSASSILTTLYLLLLGASITLPVMMISWIDEHETDREAIRGADPRHFMTAIIKMYVCSSFGEFLDDVKVKDIEELKKVADTSTQLRQVFLTLLKYSWNFPKQIQDLFTSPQYRTHPPLQLRLAPATRSALISS